MGKIRVPHSRRSGGLHSHWPAAAVALLIAAGLATPAGAATITVDTTDQTIDGTDGHCSLPEAIFAANLDDNKAIDQSLPGQAVYISTECTAGSGDDTIVLPSGAVFQMDRIINDPYNPTGPTATPFVTSIIVIEANGSRLEHVANGINFRAFAVGGNRPGDPVGELTIRNAHIKGFTAKGGNGADGGGGGLGAGGAIYLKNLGTQGKLTIESCTFEGNGATGGNGGGGHSGGGGGLAGNGGFHSDRAAFFNGGGGGGSRGNGADGGGGGGTVTSASDLTGGFRCGGNGNDSLQVPGGSDGDDGYCPGGGGGGGESRGNFPASFTSGDGGDGDYGGGGGGGGYPEGDGGHGGAIGGGGGAGGDDQFGDAGNGGFGGGGGSYGSLGNVGRGGTFAGDGGRNGGGGGAGLGGAIFNDGGTVEIYNSTFTGNFAVRGLAGATGAQNGQDAGGAVFSVDGHLSVFNTTITGNETTGEGGGIVLYGSTRDFTGSLTIDNTIIANNGVRECFYTGDLSQVTTAGAGNLIVQNFGCPGMVLSGDPQLGPLQINQPGQTPTMAIKASSPAFNAGDNATCLKFDQRGVDRPQCGYCDIGAYEVSCVPQIQVPGDVSFPDTCLGSRSTETLNVCNTGRQDLEVGQITSTHSEFAVTTPSSQYPVIVSPDFCFPFQVRFTPTSAGAKSSILTIPTNDPVTPSATVQAAGKGTVSDIRVNGSSDFGNVCAGTLAEKSISICNVGGCDLAVSSASFSPDCSDFTLINTPFPATVSHDACLNLTIRFTPTSAGSKSCSLVIASNDPDTPSVTRTVTATTPTASIDVSPDFGVPPTVIQSLAACQYPKSFPISNTGTCDLNITNVAIGGTNGGDFSFAGLPSFPVILQPGHVVGDGALKALFKPTVLDRDRLGTLSVTYVSDPVSGATTTVQRAMCGEGVNTGARVLVQAGGAPLAKVEKIQLQRISGNRNKKVLDTNDVVLNATLQTFAPASPCAPFQYHREYGTVGNPIQLLPGSYQVTVTATVNGKRVSKTVGFDVGTCGFNATIVVDF